MTKVTVPPQQSTTTTQTSSQHAVSRTDIEQEHSSPWSRTTSWSAPGSPTENRSNHQTPRMAVVRLTGLSQEPRPRRALPDLASIGIQQGAQPEMRSLNHRGATTLPSATQHQMSHAFGRPFDDVRIQRDSPAAQGAVQAFTQGRTIHFAPVAFSRGHRAATG